MELIGKVVGINTSDGGYNLAVNNNESTYNLKLSKDNDLNFVLGHVYIFDFERIEGERISYVVNSYKSVNELDNEERDYILRNFFPSSPISFEDSKAEIKKYLNKIDNVIIKDVVEYLLKKYEKDFYIYPAASKLHHASVGGLAYHNIGMLHFADSFIENYPYLDKNYIYAGIMLHDIGKCKELTGVEATEYTLKGQLLGHLVMGAMEIEEAAIELGYKDAKEVLLLEHMLISHHGQPQFGAAKRPLTAEALVLWHIDTIDSKFRVLGEELEKTKSGCYTENIGVIDRQKIYKP